MNLIQLEINNQRVKVPEDTTILEAARKQNIDVPTLCYLNGSERFTSCMICVVYEKRSGRLLPSCSMPVAEGMQIETSNAKVNEARKDALV